MEKYHHRLIIQGDRIILNNNDTCDNIKKTEDEKIKLLYY